MGDTDQYTITKSTQSKPASYDPLSSCHLPNMAFIAIKFHQSTIHQLNKVTQGGHYQYPCEDAPALLQSLTNSVPSSLPWFIIIPGHSLTDWVQDGLYPLQYPPIVQAHAALYCLVSQNSILSAPHQSVHYWPYPPNVMAEFNSNWSKGQFSTTLAKS